MSKVVIFESMEDGFWYFWSDDYERQIGPYATEDDAMAGWLQYCKQVVS